MKPHWTIACKESAQMLRSQRGLLWLLAFSGLLSAFSLLLVSNAELSLLDNAQVVYMMSGTVLAAGALLTVILGSDAYAGALNTFDSVIIDSEPFSAQFARLLLVAVWLGLCLLAARRSAAHPKFQ
jgi:hypothetical protein